MFCCCPDTKKTNTARRRLQVVELISSCSRGNNTCWAQQPGQGGDIPKQEPKPSPLHTQSSLATSSHQLLLFAVKSPAFHKPACPSSTEPSTAIPSLMKQGAVPGSFTPCPDSATNSRASPGGSVTAVPAARGVGTPHLHNPLSDTFPSCWNTEAQRGLHPAPQPCSSAGQEFLIYEWWHRGNIPFVQRQRAETWKFSDFLSPHPRGSHPQPHWQQLQMLSGWGGPDTSSQMLFKLSCFILQTPTTNSLDGFGSQVGLAVLRKASLVLHCLPKIMIFLKKKQTNSPYLYKGNSLFVNN